VTIYLGTQGWSYKDWVGSFYPPGTRASDYLEMYARIFNAVELDTTFYATPPATRVDAWERGTPPGFQFTAKTPRAITHDQRLVSAGNEMREFVDVMTLLGPKLGAILIQMPPDFSTQEQPALERFLEALPHGPCYAVELRHRSWLREETADLLRQYDAAWTMNDLPYLPIHTTLTTSFTYVRWLGDHRRIIRMNETQIDRREDLLRWADVLETIAHEAERVYGFANNHYSGHSPADIRFLRRQLDLPDATDLPTQGSLL
jgi:uncharacterized protein YecE (DUF72 family)